MSHQYKPESSPSEITIETSGEAYHILVHNQDYPIVNEDERIWDSIHNVFDAAKESPWPVQWVEAIAPYLTAGGKPVAVILALGTISIPLTLGGSAWASLMLAAGAVVVAIRAIW
jgi:hypothetical protein